MDTGKELDVVGPQERRPSKWDLAARLKQALATRQERQRTLSQNEQALERMNDIVTRLGDLVDSDAFRL